LQLSCLFKKFTELKVVFLFMVEIEFRFLTYRLARLPEDLRDLLKEADLNAVESSGNGWYYRDYK
jgi:hypothetical protein